MRYDPVLHIVLVAPEIPPNAGNVGRTCVAIAAKMWLVRPLGFSLDDYYLRRAGLDYLAHLALTRHESWEAFEHWRMALGVSGAFPRLVLLTTRAEAGYLDHRFREDDILLLGRESAGVPDHVHDAADARIRVPMRTGLRSLNVAVAAAMVTGEALRQTQSAASSARPEG